MKHIKTYEAGVFNTLLNLDLIEYASTKENEEKALVEIKKALKNGADINFQDGYNGDTALIKAAYFDNYSIVDYLIKKGAYWTIKDDQNCDFWFYLNSDMRKVIQNKYPDKYEAYLLKTTANKYNL